jgi:tetratricopeptide (TPR) repeat protein
VYRDELTLWQDTVQHAGRNPRAHASLAGAYVAADRWDDAIAEYGRALALRPDYADAHNDLALALAHVGKLDEALIHAEAAAQLMPEDADIQYNLGLAYARIGREADAAVHYEAALRLRPNFSAAETTLGQIQLRLGHTAAAIAHLENALRAIPHDLATERSLGLALLQAGRRDEAVARLRAIATRENTAAAHNDLGLALAETGRARDALTEFETTLKLQPDFAGAEINAANACLVLNDRARATAYLRSAVQHLPQNAELHYNLGAVLATSGRVEEARVEFDTALKLNPSFGPAREALDRLR